MSSTSHKTPSISLKKGYCVIDNFLSAPQCKHFLELIATYQAKHPVPEVIRENPQQNNRALHYWVIDGLQIETHLPEIWKVYQLVNQVVNELSGKLLTLLGYQQVGVNINIMKGGCEYRWHYDRNAVTAILYLNEVAGGTTEIYPNYRLHLGRNKHSKLQHILDFLLQVNLLKHLFSTKHSIAPRQNYNHASRSLFT